MKILCQKNKKTKLVCIWRHLWGYHTLWEVIGGFCVSCVQVLHPFGNNWGCWSLNMRVLCILGHNNLCYFQPYANIAKEITTSILNFVTIMWVMHKWKVGVFFLVGIHMVNGLCFVKVKTQYTSAIIYIYIYYEIFYRHTKSIKKVAPQACLKMFETKEKPKDVKCEIIYFKHHHHLLHDPNSIYMLSHRPWWHVNVWRGDDA
jgi:hypothetical protein